MRNAFPSLALHCLGPPSARVDGREAPPDVLWRKHPALLTYLALSPDGTRSRSHLLGLLWPESSEDKARRSLNEAVRRLRSALGTERLLTRGDALQLNAAELDVDVRQFETLRAEGQLRALELLRGEFLEGFHVDDAPAFEDWMDTQRAQIRQAATGLLVARAEEQLAVNRYVEARALARPRAPSSSKHLHFQWGFGRDGTLGGGRLAGQGSKSIPNPGYPRCHPEHGR